MKQYVFGYGSLINPQSISRTLGRTLAPGELTVGTLFGYRRDWSLQERVTLEAGQTVSTRFLNIRAQASSRCNGILFPVTAEELAALDERERNYRRVPVTDQVTPRRHGTVYTYLGNAQYLQFSDVGIVLRRYVRLVEAGLCHFGDTFAEEFNRTTYPHELSLVDGLYRLAERGT